MNMQAMLKQAQAMQRDMLKAKNEIDVKDFVTENQMVEVTMKGSKEITKIKINSDIKLDYEDVEILKDMLMVAINDTIKKIDKETEQKLGRYTNGLPGLF